MGPVGLALTGTRPWCAARGYFVAAANYSFDIDGADGGAVPDVGCEAQVQARPGDRAARPAARPGSFSRSTMAGASTPADRTLGAPVAAACCFCNTIARCRREVSVRGLLQRLQPLHGRSLTRRGGLARLPRTCRARRAATRTRSFTADRTGSPPCRIFAVEQRPRSLCQLASSRCSTITFVSLQVRHEVGVAIPARDG
jgi:hypothetical protein